MQAKNFGALLKQSRESHAMTRELLAKRLKISAFYVAHLENRNPAAPISENLLTRIKAVLGIRRGVKPLVDRQNALVRRYVKARRA